MTTEKKQNKTKPHNVFIVSCARHTHNGGYESKMPLGNWVAMRQVVTSRKCKAWWSLFNKILQIIQD